MTKCQSAHDATMAVKRTESAQEHHFTREEIHYGRNKTKRLIKRFRELAPVSGKSIKIGIGHPLPIRLALKAEGLFADIKRLDSQVCDRYGRYVPVYLVSFW